MSSSEFYLDSAGTLTSYDINYDEDDLLLEPWENLIHYLNENHLKILKNIFKNEDNSDKILSKQEFIQAIDSVVESSQYSLQAVSLFNEIPAEDYEKITWKQFIDYYIENAITKEKFDIQLSEPNILPISHAKKEAIIKIVQLETEYSSCYAIVSKYGKIGLYTGDLIILTTYQAIFTRSDSDFDKYSRRKSLWVTDAIFLSENNIFAVCSSARSIIFYDAVKQNHIPLWLIEGIPNAIYTLEYFYENENTSKLFLGDDSGSIYEMSFIQQQNGLLRKKHNDRLSTYFWKELKRESAYVQIEKYSNIHSNAVLSLDFNPKTCNLISCSRDYKKAVVIFNIKEKCNSYCFKTDQGINCFSFNYKLHVLMTGNDTGTIYFWNTFVPNKPVATSKGHESSIIDVQILISLNAALSCSRDACLKVWSLNSFNCMQTIRINFPSFQILGKLIEWGTSTIYPGPKRYIEMKSSLDQYEDSARSIIEDQLDVRNSFDPWKRSSILITCCNYVAKIQINNLNDVKYFESSILPPPPIQNDVVVPNDWTIINEEELKEKLKKKNESCITDANLEIIKSNPVLKSILEKDFLKSARERFNINQKIEKMEFDKIEMLKTVSLCAPFSALELQNIHEVHLSSNLPIPDCKETQKIAERTHRLLSAASTRSEILSDRSSKSKSSRSSIIEF